MVFLPNPLTKLPPQNVSPLIRAARWSALIFGFVYGRTRYNYLERKERPIQDEWDQLKAARKTRLAKEHEEFSRQQMIDLKKETEKGKHK